MSLSRSQRDTWTTTGSAGPGERRHQPGRLRIVQQHQVAGAEPGRQLGRVLPQYRLVVLGFGRAQVAVVADRAVDPVVQPLGDGEEGRVAADDRPLCRYAD